MTNVARVQDEGGRSWQCINLVDGGLQRADDIGVCRLVKAHVAVADLNEAQLPLMLVAHWKSVEAVGLEHSSTNHAHGASARPCHALQKAPPVNSVVVVVMQKLVSGFACHR